jgi:hypothetical protein
MKNEELTQTLSNEKELVDIRVTGKERLSRHHLCKKTAHRPNIHFSV